MQNKYIGLRRLVDRYDGLKLFDYSGFGIVNPFVDETMKEPVDPIEYYGAINISQAYKTLCNMERYATIVNQDASMLLLIADALHSYNEKGIAVITGNSEHDPRDVAHYVLQVLHGLKCSYDHHYNDVEHSYFIEDNMSE